MNRECHGDWFLFDGDTYYRCFGDGSAWEIERTTVICPNCDRHILGTDQGAITQRDILHRTVIFADGRETLVKKVSQ